MGAGNSFLIRPTKEKLAHEARKEHIVAHNIPVVQVVAVSEDPNKADQTRTPDRVMFVGQPPLIIPVITISHSDAVAVDAGEKGRGGWREEHGCADSLEEKLLDKLQAASAAHGLVHLETIQAAQALAKHYYASRKLDQAQYLLEQCLKAMRETCGDTASEEVLSVMNDLGNIYFQQGLFGQAEPFYRAALTNQETLLGPTAAATLVSLNNLALLLKATGHVEAAVPLLRDCLLKRQIALGEASPDTLRTQALLGNAYKELKKYDLALPLYLDVVQKRNADPHKTPRSGHNHNHTHTHTHGPGKDVDLDTIAVKNALAGVYLHTGRLGDAEKLYAACWEEMKGSGDPGAFKSLHNLAKVREKSGRWDEAVRTHLQCLALRRRALGDKHPHTLHSVRSVADIYTRRGMLAVAEPYRQEALGRRLVQTEEEFVAIDAEDEEEEEEEDEEEEDEE